VTYQGHTAEVGAPVAYVGEKFVTGAASAPAPAQRAKRAPRAVTRGESSPSDQAAKRFIALSAAARS
jgi:hypothetical protein